MLCIGENNIPTLRRLQDEPNLKIDTHVVSEKNTIYDFYTMGSFTANAVAIGG